jgi:hypothetical protein
MKHVLRVACVVAGLMALAGPAAAQAQNDCTSDGYCPVYGADGTTVMYWTRPGSYFRTDEGRDFLENAPPPDEDEIFVVAPVLGKVEKKDDR